MPEGVEKKGLRIDGAPYGVAALVVAAMLGTLVTGQRGGNPVSEGAKNSRTTPRSDPTLAGADVLAATRNRVARVLMEHFAIPTDPDPFAAVQKRWKEATGTRILVVTIPDPAES